MTTRHADGTGPFGSTVRGRIAMATVAVLFAAIILEVPLSIGGVVLVVAFAVAAVGINHSARRGRGLPPGELIAAAAVVWGVGASSLTRLRTLPVDVLKVARSPREGIADDTQAHAVLSAVGRRGRDLGMATVAEGVEDATTARIVRDTGFSWAQGWHFHRPGPADALHDMHVVHDAGRCRGDPSRVPAPSNCRTSPCSSGG